LTFKGLANPSDDVVALDYVTYSDILKVKF
jgi:hypothetical protein